MKPIGITEIHDLKNAIQYFQDCYLVSSIGALTNSTNGRQILKENIAHINNGYRIKFRNFNGQNKDFFISKKEMDDLVYMDKYLNPVPIDAKYPHNPIIKAIEVAMNKIIHLDPSKKPWICRIAKCNERFEFNKPSIFLEMFTGKKPITINEGNLRLNLKSKEKESRELLNQISKSQNNSFVLGTAFGFYKKLNNTHCYSLMSADKDSHITELFDHRRQKTIKLTFDEIINHIKFIVGYFDKDLI